MQNGMCGWMYDVVHIIFFICMCRRVCNIQKDSTGELEMAEYLRCKYVNKLGQKE